MVKQPLESGDLFIIRTRGSEKEGTVLFSGFGRITSDGFIELRTNTIDVTCSENDRNRERPKPYTNKCTARVCIPRENIHSMIRIPRTVNGRGEHTRDRTDKQLIELGRNWRNIPTGVLDKMDK